MEIFHFLNKFSKGIEFAIKSFLANEIVYLPTLKSKNMKLKYINNLVGEIVEKLFCLFLKYEWFSTS